MSRRIIIGVIAALLVMVGIMAVASYQQSRHQERAEPYAKRVELQPHDVIKGVSYPSLYYLGTDGKRYVFTDDRTYYTWYDGFDQVKTISDKQLGEIPIGGNVTYRPGVKLVKIPSDPTVYAVSKNGMLRAVRDIDVLIETYGEDWEQDLHDIPETLFFAYRHGPDITDTSQYVIEDEMARSPDISTDKGLALEPADEDDADTNPSAE